MLKIIKYIGAVALMGLPFMACTDDVASNTTNGEYTISETGKKTPLEMAVTLQDSYAGPKTRALNGTFEINDELVAYVEQVAKVSDAYGTSGMTDASKVAKKVTFKVDQKEQTITADHLGVALYWDDFSNTSDDITASDRYLRVGYGFCYNGGTPDPSTGDINGVVGWSVQTDQTTAEYANVRKSDLLWAGPQTAVKYDPEKVRPNVADADKVKLPVIYTHTMSKVTIELVLADGFKKDADGKATDFGSNATTPILHANTEALEIDAINQTITSKQAPVDIQMYLADDESTTKCTRVYEAIIAPTVMKAGNSLATVTVGGNTYELMLTDAILTTSIDSKDQWSTKLAGYTVDSDADPKTVQKSEGSYSASNGGITLSGVNYRLIAKLKKQRIEVEAKILPWNDVYASMDGKISFNADVVTSVEKDGSTPLTAGSFDLWRATANTQESDYDYNNSDLDGITKASTYQYTTNGKWEVMSGNNILYWENATTPYYFRALATAGGYDTDGKVTSLVHVDCDGKDGRAAAQGTDLLWAQTTKHEAKDANGNFIPHPEQAGEHKIYEAGVAIDPRTGNVPLTFEHAMSKVSVTLATTKGADKVDLTDATLSIINLYNGGTISVMNGKISDLTAPTAGQDPMTIDHVSSSVMQSGVIVIPQSLIAKEDGSARTLTPVFYSSDELTGIYSNGSSLAPSGETAPEKYYLTRELTAVRAELYASDVPADVEYINTENAKLAGAVKIGDIKEPAVDQVDYDYAEFNSQSVKRHQKFTQEQFALLIDENHSEYWPARLNTPARDAEPYSALSEFRDFINTNEKYLELSDAFRIKETVLYQTVSEYNEAHKDVPGFTAIDEDAFNNLTDPQKIKEVVYYSYDEFKSSANLFDLFQTRLRDNSIVPLEKKIKTPAQPAVYYSYEQYITLEAITQDMFNALPPVLKIKTPAKEAVLYKTDDEVNAYNATLEGALHVGDVKIPAHYELPGGKTPSNTTLTSHEVGALETVGDKIVLYVFLQDGTRYSAELSLCQETDADGSPLTNTDGSPKLVKVWEPNHHYHYTITLAKDQITFRALVKDWVVKRVGGSATLDWD